MKTESWKAIKIRGSSSSQCSIQTVTLLCTGTPLLTFLGAIECRTKTETWKRGDGMNTKKDVNRWVLLQHEMTSSILCFGFFRSFAPYSVENAQTTSFTTVFVLVSGRCRNCHNMLPITTNISRYACVWPTTGCHIRVTSVVLYIFIGEWKKGPMRTISNVMKRSIASLFSTCVCFYQIVHVLVWCSVRCSPIWMTVICFHARPYTWNMHSSSDICAHVSRCPSDMRRFSTFISARRTAMRPKNWCAMGDDGRPVRWSTCEPSFKCNHLASLLIFTPHLLRRMGFFYI